MHENKVELMGTYGGDETHALSAWTSTSRELTDEKRGRIDKLLKYLAENDHETPFEKSSLHFLVTCDIASHIHVLKHRVGVSVNGESARYKELKDDKFYIPEDWNEQEQNILIEHTQRSLELYHAVFQRLVKDGVSKKRAKESARFYLPYNTQITSDVMFNFRSFVHFLRLRYSMHAQVEIREIAKNMAELVVATGTFNKSLEAFGLLIDGQLRQPFE